ncbi:predicted DNA packaging protein A or DNA maturase A [Citrobacter phage CR8]|uniref:Predicted DNA packaging protein A or DNA maturase A n=1 Tax=Citrobacter phage CR8 TaxID=1455076 RepID=W6PPP8_9CAUD|nr:terminase small subunit [Citrobacter phage CR8]CDM21635.1 predicted DNA packaging protein A or DNA maturase A [Citrobacter phage CR8]
MSFELEMERMLQALATQEAKYLLEDFKNPEKRTPQLYGSVNKLLTRYAFQLSKIAVDEKALADMQELEKLYEANQKAMDDDDTYGYTVQ